MATEDNASAKGYEPPTEFKQADEDPLFEISVADSTELWLIQLPPNQFKPADFDGKKVKLKLHRNGRLGSLENAAGKSFDIVSNGSHQSNAAVFVAGSSSTRAVGKISRRVSLVSFEADAETHGKARGGLSSLMNWSSGGSSNRVGSHGNTSLTNSRQRSSQGISGTSFEGGEASQLLKQRRVDRSPSSQHSKPTMKGSQSPGSLNASQRSSQLISETSFEGREPSESRKQRHVDRSPSSQDSKRSRGAAKSGTSDVISGSESVSKQKNKPKGR